LNSIAEQYNIIAKFGTFFYEPPGICTITQNFTTLGRTVAAISVREQKTSTSARRISDKRRRCS